MTGRILTAALLALAMAGLTDGSAHAQAWPSRPVRIVVGFPPGGTTDVMARIVAQRLSERLGEQFVVDNRGGASGMIGGDVVAKAAPDGHTLLITSSTVGTYPSLYAGKVPHDVVADFTPISLVATTPYILVVNPDVPVKTVPELIGWLKARPGQVHFASSSNGTAQHLSGELLKTMAGVDITHVPYKGSGAAMTDLMSGQVSMMFENVTLVVPQMAAGKMRGLAVTSARPSAVAPDLPTLAQSGLPGFEVIGWFGFYGPAKLPADIVARLNAEIVSLTQDPEASKRLLALGAEPVGSSPAALDAFLRGELAKWGKVIQDAGIKAD